MVKRSGLRYDVDRAAQSFGPQRAVDAWGLRHPAVNAAAFVVLGAFFAVLFSLTTHSWALGLLGGLGIAVAAAVSTGVNHRRRVANGTSAEYGPPRD